MSDVAAPGWARLTGLNLGRVVRPSRGSKRAEKRNILPRSTPAKGFAVSAKTFGKPAHRFHAKNRQIEGPSSIGSSRMTQGSLWLFSVTQGLGVLALNVAMRALVS
jgi:hypothetical protein